MTKSPIEELFTDTGLVDADTLTNALKPFLRFQRDKNEIFLTDVGNKLNLILKIIVYGLGKKLLKIGEYIDSELFSAKEISDRLGLKKGSVDFTFNALRKSGYVMGSGSDYSIPNYKISDILIMLNDIKKG